MQLTPLRPYARTPLRLGVQLIADVLVLAWTIGWIWVATRVHSGLLALASAGFGLRDGAGGVAGSLTRAGEGVRNTPLIGDALASPLGSAGTAAGHAADAGSQLGDRFTGAALPVAVAVVVATVLPVALPWFAVRWRYARRAGATTALMRRPGGERLLALRAMAGRSPARLLALHPDVVDAWTRQDPEVTEALARMEMRALGLQPRFGLLGLTSRLRR